MAATLHFPSNPAKLTMLKRKASTVAQTVVLTKKLNETEVDTTETRPVKRSKTHAAANSMGATFENLKGLKPERAQEYARLDWQNLEESTMHVSWCDALQAEFKKEYFNELKSFLVSDSKKHTIFPALKDVYSWSRLTPLDKVKVVVIGQDPYHGVGQAHGLAFSVLPPTKPPPSLRNIYQQIAKDVPSFVIPKTGDLTPLAQAGVLFLNSALTVRSGLANSHAGKGWETFTAEALRAVVQRENAPGVVVMAWGAYAQNSWDSLGVDESKHLVLRSSHPSPLSARRSFIGNSHFKLANEWLRKHYGPEAEIDWTVISG